MIAQKSDTLKWSFFKGWFEITSLVTVIGLLLLTTRVCGLSDCVYVCVLTNLPSDCDTLGNSGFQVNW